MKMGPTTVCPGATTPQMGVPSGFIPGASAAARACMLVLVARNCAWSQGGGSTGGGGATAVGGAIGASIGWGGGGLPQPLPAAPATARIELETCNATTFMIRLTFIASLDPIYNAPRGAAIPRGAPSTIPT